MIKVGIIGSGNWRAKLAHKFHQLSAAELVWGCDIQLDRLASPQAHYPQIRTSQGYYDLLNSNVDAIVIATPALTHHRLAIEALRADKHVFVEKPLAMTTAEAKAIVREGKRRNRIVMVGHICEYNPAVEAIRTLIAGGELGELYYINAIRANLSRLHPDVNVTWDLAVHDVSTLRFILDLVPQTIRARGRHDPQRV